MAYSKSAWAKQLGVDNKTLENMAKDAGYDTTEEFFIATGGTGVTAGQAQSNLEAQIGQFAEEADAFITEYQTAIPEIQSELSEQFYIPQLSQAVETGIQRVEDVRPQEEIQAKKFGISAPDLARRISGREAEAIPIAQKAIQQFQTARGMVNDLFAQRIAPYKIEAQMLASRQAMEMTGYNQNIANQLTIALANLEQSNWTDRFALQSAADLALKEKEFDLKLQNSLALYDYQQEFGTDMSSADENDIILKTFS